MSFKSNPMYVGPEAGRLKVGHPVDYMCRRGDCLEELAELYEAAGRVFSLPPLEAFEQPELLEPFLRSGWLQWDQPFCGPTVDLAEGCEIRRAGRDRVLYKTRSLRVETEGGREVHLRHLVPMDEDASSFFELVIVFRTATRDASCEAAEKLMREYPSSDTDYDLQIVYAEV